MIAVYGGCFNPPTIAHIKTVETMLKLKDMTKVIVIPLSDKYEKPGLASGTHRYEMMKLCFKNEPRVKLSSLDLRSSHQLTTIEYMEIYGELFDEPLAFVCGTDNLRYLSTWNDADKILRNYDVIIVKRDSESLEDIIDNDELLRKHKEKFITINDIGVDTKLDISSTKARNCLKSCDDKGLQVCVTKDIAEYANKNGLYR